MNTKTKKVIAREFLVLMICLFVAIITFSTIHIKNIITENKINNIEKDIAIKNYWADSLAKPYELKAIEQSNLISHLVIKLELGNDAYKEAKIFGQDYYEM